MKTLPRPLLLALCLTAVLSSCTWKEAGIARITQEAHRTNLVIDRPTSRSLVAFRDAAGAPATARLIAKEVAKVAAFDRIYCPAGGIPGCDTTSEYISRNPNDLNGALNEVKRQPSRCLTLTVLPPYNWTHKGSSTGCFG